MRMRQVRKRISIIVLFIFVSFTSIPAEIFAEEKPPGKDDLDLGAKIDLGRDWLVKNQHADGSWGEGLVSQFRDTSEIVTNITDQEAQESAAKWLRGNKLHNVDFLARALPHLEDAEQREVTLQKMISWQNEDGGWGLKRGFTSDVFDTTLALDALLYLDKQEIEETDRAVYYLLKSQNDNGSWTYNEKQEDSIHVTSRVILTLNEFVSKGERTSKELNASIKNAGDYLLKHQQGNQSWGLDATELPGTLLAYQAIVQTNGTEKVEGLKKHILDLQDADGSWAGDPYTTALAIQALTSDQAASDVKISDIKLYKISDEQRVEADKFKAYEIAEIEPVYESSTEDIDLLAFIKTPEGKYQAVNAEEKFRWDTREAAPGTYTAVVQIKDKSSGKVLSQKEKNFEIVSSFKAESASIRLSPDTVTVGEEKEIHVQVSLLHSSNTPGTVTKKVEIVNAAGEVVSGGEKKVTSVVDQPVINTNILTFMPDTTEETTYQVKASIYESGEKTLDAEREITVLPLPPTTRVDVEQSLDKKVVVPGSDSIQAHFDLTGVGQSLEAQRKPIDMVYVLDVSGSMGGLVNQTKDATKKLLELIQQDDRGAVIFFNSSAHIIQNFTADIDLLKAAADKAYASGGTAIHASIQSAQKMIETESNENRERIIVLLSDGGSSRPSAIAAANLAGQAGTTIHTIGLGNGADQYLLGEVAAATGGTYQFSPSTKELESLMNEIGGEIFNLAGKNVTLQTTVPDKLVFNPDQSNPKPSKVMPNEDGTKTFEWDYDLIVMDQVKKIEMLLKGENFTPGALIDVTSNTKLTYTAETGEQKVIKLDNMQVQVAGSVQTEVVLDKEEATTKEDLGIEVKVTNHAKQEKNLVNKVEIQDEDGSTVERIANYPIDKLAESATDTKRFTWNTGSTYAGKYQVVVTTEEEGVVVSQDKQAFTIKPAAKLKLETKLKKTAIQAEEDLHIDHRVRNLSVNSSHDNLKLVTKIYDSEDNEKHRSEMVIAYIGTDQIMDHPEIWQHEALKPGAYHVKTELWSGKTLEAEGTASFKVLSSSAAGTGISGSLQLEETEIIQGSPARISYVLKNIGNDDIEQADIQLLILNPESEEIIHESAAVHSLKVSESAKQDLVLETNDWAEGMYIAELRVKMPDGESINLDSKAFSLSIPNEIEIDKGMENGARVLLLVEDEEDNSWAESLVRSQTEYYKVVSNQTEFMSELRTDKYNLYLIADGNNPLNGRYNYEIRTKINNGHSLVYTQFLPYYYNGKKQQSGKTKIMSYTANHKGQGFRTYVDFTNSHLKMLSTEQLAQAVLSRVQIDSSSPGDVQMVKVTVKNLKAAADVQVTEELPDGVTVADSLDFDLMDGSMVWRGKMNSGEEKTLRYMVRTPDKKGTYLLKTEGGVWKSQNYIQLASKTTELIVSSQGGNHYNNGNNQYGNQNNGNNQNNQQNSGNQYDNQNNGNNQNHSYNNQQNQDNGKQTSPDNSGEKKQSGQDRDN